MAHMNTNIHIRPEDVIEARRGTRDPSIRWISIGNSDLSIFAPDEQMRALRDAIDAYLQPAQAQQSEAA